MRTTVTLSDAAAELVVQYKETQGVSASRAVSDLIERGGRRKPRIKFVDDTPVFDVPEDAPEVTLDDIKELESDGY